MGNVMARHGPSSAMEIGGLQLWGHGEVQALMWCQLSLPRPQAVSHVCISRLGSGLPQPPREGSTPHARTWTRTLWMGSGTPLSSTRKALRQLAPMASNTLCVAAQRPGCPLGVERSSWPSRASFPDSGILLKVASLGVCWPRYLQLQTVLPTLPRLLAFSVSIFPFTLPSLCWNGSPLRAAVLSLLPRLTLKAASSKRSMKHLLLQQEAVPRLGRHPVLLLFCPFNSAFLVENNQQSKPQRLWINYSALTCTFQFRAGAMFFAGDASEL